MPSDEMVEKVARAIPDAVVEAAAVQLEREARSYRWIKHLPPLEQMKKSDPIGHSEFLDVAARIVQAALAAAEAGEQPVASGDEEAQCYPVHLAWSEEDEAWIATSPDLPGCCAVGDSRHEAVREMQDAIFSWIDAAKEAGRSIPKATLSKPPEWAPASPPSEASRDERVAIRKEAFEEAARIAEATKNYDDNLQRSAGALPCGERIATAIRARGTAEPADPHDGDIMTVTLSRVCSEPTPSREVVEVPRVPAQEMIEAAWADALAEDAAGVWESMIARWLAIRARGET